MKLKYKGSSSNKKNISGGSTSQSTATQSLTDVEDNQQPEQHHHHRRGRVNGNNIIDGRTTSNTGAMAVTMGLATTKKSKKKNSVGNNTTTIKKLNGSPNKKKQQEVDDNKKKHHNSRRDKHKASSSATNNINDSKYHSTTLNAEHRMNNRRATIFHPDGTVDKVGSSRSKNKQLSTEYVPDDTMLNDKDDDDDEFEDCFNWLEKTLEQMSLEKQHGGRSSNNNNKNNKNDLLSSELKHINSFKTVGTLHTMGTLTTIGKVDPLILLDLSSAASSSYVREGSVLSEFISENSSAIESGQYSLKELFTNHRQNRLRKRHGGRYYKGKDNKGDDDDNMSIVDRVGNCIEHQSNKSYYAI